MESTRRSAGAVGVDRVVRPGGNLDFKRRRGPISRKRSLAPVSDFADLQPRGSMVELIGLSVAPSASGAMDLKPKGAGLRLSLSLRAGREQAWQFR